MNRLFIFVVFTILLASCSTSRQPRRDYPDDRSDFPFPRSEKNRDKDQNEDQNITIFPFNTLGIPKGHLPPPGECKIWIPGKEPGQQGPPQSCSSALRNSPPGAWVITHEGSRYRVNIFNKTRRSVIDEVRYYLLGE